MEQITNKIVRIAPWLLDWCIKNINLDGKNDFKGNTRAYANNQSERYIMIKACDTLDCKNLHFEYYQGHVELHFEYQNAPNDFFSLNDYLRSKVCDSIDFVWLPWQGKQFGRCQLRTPITNCQVLKWAFEKMYNTFFPLIEDLQKNEMYKKDIGQRDLLDYRSEQDCIIVSKAGDVLNNTKIKIPPYQRPYRWQFRKHVRQLLNDIIEHLPSGNEYRMGTVILHMNGYKLDVVDGQQRLVSLSVILKVLDVDTDWIKEIPFNHIDSRNNLRYNFLQCENFFKEYSDEEKKKISDYILNGCSFSVIVVHNLDDAFQLFDSQNSKGKALNPADLLKAFHLREMGKGQELEKRNIVTQWEKAIDEKILSNVLGDYLFRIRCWNRNEWNYYFTRDEVDEFKGVTLNKNDEKFLCYPYQERLWLIAKTQLFQINSEIINGKFFFDYVFHYINLYKELKTLFGESKRLWRCDEIDNNVVQNGDVIYPGYRRTGDSRLLNLYKISLLAFIDRFGMCSEFYEYSRLSFCWIFKHRLMQSSIFYQTILGIAREWNPCYVPFTWTKPQLQSLENKYYKLPLDGYAKPNVQLEKIIEILKKM